MNVITKSPKTVDDVFEPNSITGVSTHSFPFIQEILDRLPDGILIVSDTGKILHSNRLGRHLCDQLIDRPTSIDSTPKPVWQLCQTLLESQQSLRDDSRDQFLIEEDIQTTHGRNIRARVQFLNQDSADLSMLVVLEDRFQAAHARAIAEGYQYGLTSRESEVWKYRCIGCTYKDISQKLFITVDTVKKHVKSIHSKRETFQLLKHAD
ncbi:MAG: helix-turn-helix transcriptional regulator [Leptolyngbyaceae bacterium]|nr:helix-turn-helix transcriptional regulator [Leptolyngbyaceae bacterium]